ncbi:MAG: hypothetical protein K8I27_01410 [Planctomycetes bacterium]|nr:hypothetical protein [Planctomycetota bacterium]
MGSKRVPAKTMAQQIGLTRYHQLPEWMTLDEAKLVRGKMRQWGLDSFEQALRRCVAQGLVRMQDEASDE